MSETTAPSTGPVQNPANYDPRVEVTLNNSPYSLVSGKNYTAETTGDNGGVFSIVKGGTLTGDTASFTGNYADNGGAINNNLGTATISGVTFSGNSAGLNGGAINNVGGTMTISDSIFADNLVEGYNVGKGGAVSNISAGLMFFSGVTFSGNSSNCDAGAINVDGATMTFTDSLFTGNSAEGNSGVFRSLHGTVTISGSTFSANAAKSYGVISTQDSDLFAITDTLFTGNTASDGISCILNNGTMTLSGVTFSGNIDSSAANPCAIYNNTGFSIVLAGEVILATDSDVISNGIYANMYWDLTGETYGSLSGYEYFKNHDDGYLYLKVSDTIATGDSFTIATGDFSNVSGKKDFTFTGVNSANPASITIGGAAKYGEQGYALAVAGDKLTLTAIDIIDQREEVADGAASSLQSGCYYVCPATDQNGGAFDVAQGGTLTGATATFYGNTADYGAAINNGGTVNISDVTFTGNIAASGGAVNNGGSLTVTACIFAGNSGNSASSRGGALENIKTAVITDSTFTGNMAGNGGAVCNDGGTLNVTGTVFSGNTASDNGGAVCVSTSTAVIAGCTFTGNMAGNGGAVNNYAGTVSLSGSTFAGNVAGDGGAFLNNEGTAVITDVLFAGNTGNGGGAVYNMGGTMTISDTTFAGNFTAAGGALLNYGSNALLTLAGVTFTGNVFGSWGGAVFNDGSTSATTVLAGEVVLSTESDTFFNPGNMYWDLTGETAGSLSGYQYLNNSGTMFLKVSDTIATGDSFTIATGDFANIDGKDTFYFTGIDGADEASITIGGTANYNNQDYVLAPVGDELTLHAVEMVTQREEIAGGTVATLQTGAWYICDPVNKKGGVFNVAEGAALTGGTATFYGNTIYGNGQHGGAIYSKGLLELSDVAFINNLLDNDFNGCGGAVCNDGGTMTLTNAFFSGNRSYYRGGAVSNESDSLAIITGSTFVGNIAVGYGPGTGGVIQSGGTTTLEECLFAGNTAKHGGAVYNNSNEVNCSGCTFTGNIVAANGGAVYVGGTVGITDSTFTGNTAVNGGAIYNDQNAVLTLTGSTFAGNTCATSGGAIYNNGGTATISDSIFAGNIASNVGGAIFSDVGLGDNAVLAITGSTFAGNTSGVNTSEGKGGAIYINGGTATISDSTFAGNIASDIGGAVTNYAMIAFSNVTFSGNTAGVKGGAINNTGIGTMTLAGVTFSGNTAAKGGNAIYNEEYGILNFAGDVILATESDIITNDGDIIWDLTLTDGTAACLEGFQNLENKGNLKLKVAADIASGDMFTIATGDFSDLTGKSSFLITEAGALSTENITIGGTVNYNNQDYLLFTAGNILSLNAVNLIPNRLVVGSGESEELNKGDAFVGIAHGQEGGAVDNKGTLTGNRVIFRGNTSSLNGGGIFSNGILTLSEAIFSANTASGGAAVLNGGTATISNSVFADNIAENCAAGFFSQGTSKLSNNVFIGNTANKHSGAIYACNGTLDVNGGTFINNFGGTSGGAIGNYAEAVITDSVFTGNRVDGEGSRGGAIYNIHELTLSGVTFSGNTAAEGGAIYNAEWRDVTLTGEAVLATASDTFVNAGYLIWDLTGETAGSLTGYQYLSCSGDSAKLLLKVDGSIKSGDTFTIAAGDFTDITGKDSFCISDFAGNDVTITIGGEAVNYGGLNWSLAVAGDVTDGKLELTVEAGKPEARADFNLSGYSDVALVKNKKLSMLYDRVPGTYKKSSTLSNLGKWTLVEPEGDYNGDGRADVMITSKSDGIRTLAGLFNIGVGPQIKFKGHNIFRYKTAQWSYADSGDVNGDKITDIVIVQTAKCAKAMGFKERVVQVKQLNGDGKVGKTVKMGTLNSQWNVVTLADIDGDGTDNVILKNSKSDMVGYWKKAGASLTEIHQAADRSFIATGDFDGDGSDELLWKYDGDGTIWGWDDLASKSITEVNLGKAKAGWSFQQVGDYNGDGREEVLWAAADGRLAYSSTDKLNKLTVIAK